jgi:acyl phosphate:glycerol-3-phosphate acyltransferase
VGVLAGAAAMVGHARPVFLRFEKGGKMVATAGGAFLALAPLATLCCVGIWLAVFIVTRYASVASIVTAFALVGLVLLLDYDWPVIAFAAAGTIAIVLLHRHNLSRLARGTEHRFELRKPRRA